MCRRNHLCGCAMVAFGLGILVGLNLESGFFCCVVAVGIMVAGLGCLRKK